MRLIGKLLLILLCCGMSIALSAQPIQYSTANAHSHNDYAQDNPFWEAYNRQFGSMEADIFLLNNDETLWVAHTANELSTTKRSLDSLYLQPLAKCIRTNKGHVYADSTRKLVLLVDIKTAAVPTLDRLVKLLQQYPDIINCRSLQIAISGNRPDPQQFATYPSFIWFDGSINTTYTKPALSKIALMSASLKQFTQWNGESELPANEQALLQTIIDKMHALHKPVRFWAAPDNTTAWQTLKRLQVDYINTDHIDELTGFLK